MKKRFNLVIGKGKVPASHFISMKQRIKNWRQKERDAIVKSNKKIK